MLQYCKIVYIFITLLYLDLFNCNDFMAASTVVFYLVLVICRKYSFAALFYFPTQRNHLSDDTQEDFSQRQNWTPSCYKWGRLAGKWYAVMLCRLRRQPTPVFTAADSCTSSWHWAKILTTNYNNIELSLSQLLSKLLMTWISNQHTNSRVSRVQIVPQNNFLLSPKHLIMDSSDFTFYWVDRLYSLSLNSR